MLFPMYTVAAGTLLRMTQVDAHEDMKVGPPFLFGARALGLVFSDLGHAGYDAQGRAFTGAAPEMPCRCMEGAGRAGGLQRRLGESDFHFAPVAIQNPSGPRLSADANLTESSEAAAEWRWVSATGSGDGKLCANSQAPSDAGLTETGAVFLVRLYLMPATAARHPCQRFHRLRAV